ncbi:MAG: putative quorum-quenching lactonase YtnP [Pseudomonadota bacterium]|jgi:glyoxylase-like metal-dependent hydrolase (beta-lactamase superfamily II)
MASGNRVFVSSVEGNRQWLDGGSMFGNVPRPVWEKWAKPDARGRIELACRAMLVQIGNKKILCETGIGVFFEPTLAERYGVIEQEHRLLASLVAAGIAPDDIDFVILSHLHFDHAGGLLPSWQEIQAGNRSLLFRKARYVTGRRAFERAENPHSRDRASFIPGLDKLLKESGRLVLVDDPGHHGQAVTHPDVLPDFVSFRFSDGHTPGQMHTIITGTRDKIIFAGDLVPGRAWVHVPVSMGYDRFPEQVIDEKEGLYSAAVPEQWWMFYTHDPACAASRIERVTEGGRTRVRPVAEQPVLAGFEI